jgi:hypothetical protein
LRSLFTVAAGLLAGALIQWGCSCPSGKASAQPGNYVLSTPSRDEPDYFLEVSADRSEIIERFTQNGLNYRIHYSPAL